MNDECPICKDVRLRLKGLPESRLDGEAGLAAATMRGYEQLLCEREAAESMFDKQNSSPREGDEWNDT